MPPPSSILPQLLQDIEAVVHIVTSFQILKANTSLCQEFITFSKLFLCAELWLRSLLVEFAERDIKDLQLEAMSRQGHICLKPET